MKKSLHILVTMALLLGFANLSAQNSGSDIIEAIKRTFALKMNASKSQSNLRSDLVVEPVRLELYTYEGSASNQQLEQVIRSTWGTRSGKDVITQDELEFDGNVIRFVYTFNSNAEITGANLFVLLGPLPIPIGTVVIVKDLNGNITRAQVSVSLGELQIMEGDSTSYEYDMDQRIVAASKYFLSSDFGPDWILESQYTNIEYCQSSSVCGYEYYIYSEDNELLSHLIYSKLEWFGNYSDVFLASLQPSTDFYIINTPGLLLPQDPLDTYLSESIAGEIENVMGGWSLLRSYSYLFGSDQLCVFETLDDDFNQFFLEANCYLLNNGVLEKVDSYFEEDLSEVINSISFGYNEFGFNSSEESTNPFDGTGYLITNDFETDAGNNLIKLTSEYNGRSESGSVDFTFGTIGVYTPRNPVTSVKEINSLSNLVIFPNPASDLVNILLESERLSSGAVELIVRDLTGGVVLSELNQLEQGTFQAATNIENLVSGIYTIEVRSQGGTLLGISKFVKK